jgi:PA14 domain/Ricin-type beta-trefoil lectin domain-like/Secretion system C-terminal sorting domain
VKATDSKGLSVTGTFKVVVDYVGQLGCLKYEYYNNSTLSGTPTKVATANEIAFSAKYDPKFPPINNISLRWTGSITPSLSGAYTFTVRADDGVRLYVNNQLVVDKWVNQLSTQVYTATVNLTQGKLTPIKVEYYQITAPAELSLNWTVPNGTSKRMPFNACLPAPTTVFDPAKCYTFTAVHSGKVLEIAERSTDNGVNIQQGTWGSSRRQIWRIKPIDATYNYIMNGYSGKVMEVSNSLTTNGANIAQNANSAGDNQKWKLVKNSNGAYSLTAKRSGLVAEVKGSLTTSGANVQQYTSNAGQNQQWTLAEVGCPAGTVALSTVQIYAASGYKQGQKAVINWVSNATNADYFTVEKLDKNGNFDVLDKVNAQQNSNNSDNKYYTFTDNQIIDGENTYRVTLFADNTPPQYSDLISLNFKSYGDFSLSPNPTNDYIDVDVSPSENQRVTLTVVDAWGREVQVSTLEKAGKTQRIDVNTMPTGLYMLHIRTQGKRDVTRLFTIAQ